MKQAPAFLNSTVVLLALGLGFLLPLNAVTAVLVRRSEADRLVHHVTQDVDEYVQRLSGEIGAVIDLREQQVRLIAASSEVTRAANGSLPSVAVEFFRHEQATLRDFVSLCLVRDGRVLASVMQEPDASLCDSAPHTTLRTVHRRPLLLVSAPLAEVPGAALVVGLELTVIHTLLSLSHISHPWVVTQLVPEGGGDVRATPDVLRVHTRAKLSDRPLWVEAEVDSAQAFQMYGRLRRAPFFIFTLVNVAWFAAVIYLLRRGIARPLQACAQTTRALASGDFSARVLSEGPTEVRALAVAVNRMAEELFELYGCLERKVEERSNELRSGAEREKELRRLAEAQAERLSAQNTKLGQQAVELRVHQQALAAQNEMLEEKNKLVEHASRMKSDFLANMSHELRTPLNAIIGFSELLAEGLAGPVAHEQRQYLTDIHRGGRHLLSLINDILDYSKVEAGHLTLSLTELDLRLPVREASLMVGSLLLKKRQRLHLSQGEDTHCVGDTRRLCQVALNLLSNAVKFTPEEGDIFVSLAREGDFVELRIRDTGIGIAPEHHALIFEPFRQVDGGPQQEI